MLFTRCPHCRTTFRVTAEALEKAGGHVRCGRCSSIFNAHEALREDVADAADSAPQANAAAGGADTSAVGTADESAAENADADAEHARASEDDDGAPPAAREAAAERARAELVEAAAESVPSQTAGDDWVASVLEPPPEEGPSEAPAWSQAARRRSGWRAVLWSTASALALLALLGQGVHYFRGNLATLPRVGPLLQSVYGYFGLPLVPHWNVHQYRILKWTATAKPKDRSRNKGALLITAKIRNQGPLSQPYPYIHLRLKNRWEDVVGSRTFGPSEYLADAPAPGALMAAGTTTQAKLAVVDPGPDAYGFDLDVCVKTATKKFRCADDDVFK